MGSRINTAVDKFNLFRYRKQLTTYKMHLLACQFSLKHCVFFKLITLSFKTKLIIGNFLIINEKKHMYDIGLLLDLYYTADYLIVLHH